MTRVLIVDDHPTIREGLGHRISAQPDMTVCGEAADVAEAMEKIAQVQPDVAIVDIALKSSDGLELLKAIKSRHNLVRALVHSMYDESLYAARCLQAGAMGYVNKEENPNAVIEAIRVILTGRVYLSAGMTSEILGRSVNGTTPPANPVETLTDRQLEVFRLIGAGLSASEVATRLHISVHTVETHRDNIKHKLKVKNVTELTRHAVLWAREGG